MTGNEERKTFRLRKGSKKDVCPQCQKRRFVPYVDDDGREAIAGGVLFGRCDRESSCAYHAKPWEHGALSDMARPYVAPPRVERKQLKYLPSEWIEAHRASNVITQYVEANKGAATVEELQRRFDFGTIQIQGREHVVFWLTDESGRIHTGKAIPYAMKEGEPKRVRNVWSCHWMHRRLTPPPTENEWTQPPFGLRQLAMMPDAAVGIVESEKTALLCAAELPDVVWLSVGSKSNLTAYNNECTLMKAAKGRQIILYPDTDAVEDWTIKAGVLRAHGFAVEVDHEWLSGIEKNELKKGFDLGDVITAHWRQK